MARYNILILGASYGSLLGTKLLFGGHAVKLVCLPTEADLINSEGARVRLPIKGREGLVEIDTRKLPGELSAAGADAVNPADFDLIGLAMQEPQFSSPGVRELLDKVATSGVPCMSIMNMPPLPFLRRIPSLDAEQLRPAYTEAGVWDNFDPALITLCSPDPQAFRPPDEEVNVLQVTLPTNFKAARFESDAHTQILRDLQTDIEAARYDPGDGSQVELPVKLKVHESVFVPLAKWAMLLTGNYRCVTAQGMRSVQEAVHTNIDKSHEIYDWVRNLCIDLGASPNDLVPFEKYAKAAEVLVRPSSAARALYGGAPAIERVDRLVQLIAKQQGKQNAVIDETVALVDAQLEQNKKAS
jgi:hypothetical protein